MLVTPRVLGDTGRMGTCENCGKATAEHTLRERTACRKSQPRATSPSAIAAARRTGPTPGTPAPTRTLEIPEKVRAGRQGAAKARRRGETPTPEQLEASRVYANMRRRQLPEAERKAATARSNAKRTNPKKSAPKKVHLAAPGGARCGLGAIVAKDRAKVDCARCIELDTTPPPVRGRTHLAIDGRLLCGKPATCRSTTDEHEADCTLCQRVLHRSRNPRHHPREWHRRRTAALEILRERHQDEFDSLFAELERAANEPSRGSNRHH